MSLWFTQCWGSLSERVKNCLSECNISYTYICLKFSEYILHFLSRPNLCNLHFCFLFASSTNLLHTTIQMASRKRKSIGARPTAQYDTRRFHSLDAWNQPFTLHPEAREEQARPETAATLERSLEGTSEPSTLVADLSSPQLAADPSTPVLDIPQD
ncbi:hypothetical protein JHK87_006693 [Glycine soja]|nr:hypothetical protein JHK87_006693 [Glycine soja]